MKSMTGFGRGEARSGKYRLSVEISSVNRKQSDIVLNLPRDWTELEIEARKLIAQYVSRGRIQVYVRFEEIELHHGALKVDRDLAAAYVREVSALAAQLGITSPISAVDLLRAPGVFLVGDDSTPTEEIWPLLKEGLENALTAFNQSRLREGAHLKEDLLGRLAALREHLIAIQAEAPEVSKTQRENLRKRLAEAGLPLPLDDERLLKEIALFADRCDISEEISRLAGHLDEFERLLNSTEPQGRAMDFLTQEMNRELNTMGSKGNSTAIAHRVVAGKTEVERIREQVQNAE